MNILGINSAYHESAACLLSEGKLIAAVEEERLTRICHAKAARVDNPDDLPWRAIQVCLNSAGAGALNVHSLADIDVVAFSLCPNERFRRNTEHVHPYPVDDNSFGGRGGESLFRTKCLAIPDILKVKGFAGDFQFIDHHLCHAASSFYVSPFKQAAVLVVDGIGEFDSTSLYLGCGAELTLRHTLEFPNSLGFLWEAIAKFLGFGEYDAAKVMGLAAYGHRERYLRPFASCVDTDTLFTVDDSVVRMRSNDMSGLEDLFGLSRRTAPIENVTPMTQPYADVAAALQEATEKAILNLARMASRESESLCLSGGVALNCVANERILQSRLFERVFIQPAAHDAGTAIGAAYSSHHRFAGRRTLPTDFSPFSGPEYSDAEIETAARSYGLTYKRFPDIERATASLLASGNVLGWFQGRMEIGPRGLGNRSILADPRRVENFERLNKLVKHREPFRPFCPSVLEEEASAWFDIDTLQSPYYYMLAACKVRPEKAHLIPAVVHVDGTARIQAVHSRWNRRFHSLLQSFFEITRVPLILNTSFNDREPIVCTPEDAIRTFLASHLDYLVMGDLLVAYEANVVATTAPDIPLETYFEKLR